MVIDSSSQFVIQAAQEVVGQSDSPSERLALLFSFVRDRITYSFSAASMLSSSNPAEVFRASGTIERGYRMCIQKAVLLCALARASGFRARLSFQALRDHRLPRETGRPDRQRRVDPPRPGQRRVRRTLCASMRRSMPRYVCARATG